MISGHIQEVKYLDLTLTVPYDFDADCDSNGVRRFALTR